MPDWCYNQLSVRGPKRDRDVFRESVCGWEPIWGETSHEKLLRISKNGREGLPSEKMPLIFHNIVPVPEELLQAGYFGTFFPQNGYDWCRENWGTKWGAYRTRVRGENECLIYEFDTAWFPPKPVILEAARKWPTLRFCLHYWEEFPGVEGYTYYEAGKEQDSGSCQCEENDENENPELY